MKDRMMKVKSSGMRTVVAKDLKTFDHMINFSIEVSVSAEGRLTNIYKYRKKKKEKKNTFVFDFQGDWGVLEMVIKMF